jgi:hypothetical protein
LGRGNFPSVLDCDLFLGGRCRGGVELRFRARLGLVVVATLPPSSSTKKGCNRSAGTEMFMPLTLSATFGRGCCCCCCGFHRPQEDDADSKGRGRPDRGGGVEAVCSVPKLTSSVNADRKLLSLRWRVCALLVVALEFRTGWLGARGGRFGPDVRLV